MPIEGSITVWLTSCLNGLDFDQTSKIVVHSTKAKRMNPNEITGGHQYSDNFP